METTWYKVAIVCKRLRTTCAGLAKLSERSRQATALPDFLLRDGNCSSPELVDPCLYWDNGK